MIAARDIDSHAPDFQEIAERKASTEDLAAIRTSSTPSETEWLMTEDTNSELEKTSTTKVERSSPRYLNLPEPSEPLAPSHRIGSISWADYMDEIETMLKRFLRDHDCPKDRLARKIPERFALVD